MYWLNPFWLNIFSFLQEIRTKTFALSWRIKSNSLESLNDEIDRFKRIMLDGEQYMYLRINWVLRRAKAVVVNPDTLFDRKHYNLTYIPFVLEFRVLEKFRVVNATIESLTWLTGDFISEIYNSWSARETKPVYTFSFTTATWVDSISISVWDREITISESISDNDILVVDTDNMVVTLNWIDVDKNMI